ncbi:MAG: polyprenyl synthetase family protein [Oscillospiraceae bacterium]|jgi:geranylgeranyl diphosphate synthase type II|nr:polyprenyl synthetase family protein [Oscillospiraceae bacterium]
MQTYERLYSEYTAAINAALERYLPSGDTLQKKLMDAMRYSLFTGGKRLRPVMLLDFCRICGGEWEKALPFACALEMVHTYALIHDDMPCMDNDDDRRGRATNHIVFGEATALLAGSALLSAAFETMLRPPVSIPAEQALQAAYVIARESGFYGIAGGQELDLRRSGSVDEMAIHMLKTASMFIAAAEAGCMIAGASPETAEKAARFGATFGLGFQYADDFEDGAGNERSREAALAKYKEAIHALQVFEETAFLTTLIEKLMATLEKGGG